MFELIPTDTLEKVGGGVANDDLLKSLNGIQSSLNDLGKNQNQGFLSGSNGLMFMTMAMVAASRRQQTTVVYGGRHSYWQSSW